MGWEFLHGLKPLFGMIFVQMFFAGVNIFYKLAINDGMDLRILVAYRYLFATALLAPLAFFIERKTRPPMTWMILLQAFGCGLFGGTLCQNLYIASLTLTSATFAAAMTNLIPAITFVMALVFRMERLRFATMMGKAKVVGTLTGIGGAMLLTFYKGAEIDIWPSSLRINLVGHHSHADHPHAAVESGNRIMGSLLAIASCFSYAIWLIIQAKMSEAYPSLSSTALMCLMGSIQAVVFALLMEKDRSSWTLGWNIRLLTVFYAGFLGTGLCFTLVSWCVKKKGPLFASIFNPLMLVMVALAGSLLLDEKIHLGSVLGAILIVMGLYLVLWGKGKDIEESVQHMPLKSNNPASAARGSTDVVTVIVTEACDEATSSSLNGANHSELGGEDFITETRDKGTGESVNDSGHSEATSLPAKETV